MSLKKSIFIVDVDNTLLNTEKIKKIIGLKLKNISGKSISKTFFWTEYDNTTKKYGYNNIPRLAKSISKKITGINSSQINDLFYGVNFKSCLNLNTIKLIKLLKKRGDVIIYSLGHPDYQIVKIRESGIEKLVGKENVTIVQNKLYGLRKIIRNNINKYSEMFIIDDRADVLEKAKKVESSIITIWIKFGKYKSLIPKDKNSISLEVDNLEEVIKFIEKFIKQVYSPILNKYFSVIRGITQSQIATVVRISKSDSTIRQFTHDKFRFKSIKLFTEWSRRGKKIFTLIDSKFRILGLIWFSKKKIPKNNKGINSKVLNPYTFAVRLYKPVRGKKLSRKFILAVFQDFNPSFVWLSTAISNLTAISLYKKCGFKKVETVETNRKILMVYKKRIII